MAFLESNQQKVLISRRLDKQPHERGFPNLSNQGSAYVVEQDEAARELAARIKASRLLALRKNPRQLRSRSMF